MVCLSNHLTTIENVTTQLLCNTWPSVGLFPLMHATQPALVRSWQLSTSRGSECDPHGRTRHCQRFSLPPRQGVTLHQTLNPNMQPNTQRSTQCSAHPPAALLWRSAIGLRYVLPCLPEKWLEMMNTNLPRILAAAQGRNQSSSKAQVARNQVLPPSRPQSLADTVWRKTCLLSCFREASWRVTSPFGAMFGPPHGLPS